MKFLKTWLPLVVLVALLSGCEAKFKDTRTINLVPEDDNYPLIIDAASKNRMITVKATADVPISAHFYLEENVDEAERMITLAAPSDLIIAEVKDTKEVDFEAPLPADKSAIVWFRAPGKTATIKIDMHD